MDFGKCLRWPSNLSPNVNRVRVGGRSAAENGPLKYRVTSKEQELGCMIF